MHSCGNKKLSSPVNNKEDSNNDDSITGDLESFWELLLSFFEHEDNIITDIVVKKIIFFIWYIPRENKKSYEYINNICSIYIRWIKN